jgi:hypothetical protein
MSTLETWLRAQLGTVREDGQATSTIQLEGPDGTTWGSWQAENGKAEELARAIVAAQRLIEEELPSGRHRGKAIAADGNGAQIALLPVTFTGRSSAAAAAATEARAMQQAVALMVQNAEAVTTGLRNENERLAARNADLLEQVSNLIEGTFRFQQGIASWNAEAEATKARTERMNALFAEAKPMIELGIGLVAEEAAAWFERLKEERKARELAAKAKPALPVPDSATPPPNPPRHGGASDARAGAVVPPSDGGGDIGGGRPGPGESPPSPGRSSLERPEPAPTDGDGDTTPPRRRRATSGRKRP